MKKQALLQALHFCYGLGAFVSPMIAEPFLLNEDCSAFVDNDTEAMRAAAAELQRLIAPSGRRTVALNDTNLPADSLAEAQQMTRVRYAFWIIAAVQVIAKFHYTDPTGPDRTRTDPHGLFCGETPLGPCGSPT